MQVPNIQTNQQRPNFGTLRIYKPNMPEAVSLAIEQSKAFKKFGSRYNADVTFSYIQSRRDPSISHPSLILDKITPANILTRLIHVFKPLPKYDFMTFVSSGNKTQDLVNKINKIDDKFLSNEVKNFCSR